MSDSGSGVSFPVQKGSSLSTMERSYNVLHAVGDSFLELQLSLGGSVRTFDAIVQSSRNNSKRVSYISGTSMDDDISSIEKELVVQDIQEDSVKHLGTRQLQARSYLKRKKIFELFNLFIVQLLSAKPDNPVDFIITLLNMCMCFRVNFVGRVLPPVLFTDDQVKTVFDTFDVAKTGYITVAQYKEAMTTLGVANCKEIHADCFGQVSKLKFVVLAKRSLTAHLRALICPTPTDRKAVPPPRP